MEQRCISCDRDTAAGSPLFASRKRGLDRETEVEGYLCHACQPGSGRIPIDQTIPVSGRFAVIDLPGGGPPGG